MLKLKDRVVEQITVTRHAAGRWSQKVNPGEMLEPDEIAFLLWFHLEEGLIDWIGPKSYGIFCADNEIVFCGSFEGDRLIIQTFTGRKSTNPALHWDPAATILWHKRQRRLEMETYARAM